MDSRPRVPDIRNRLKLAIAGGCVLQANVNFDSSGNPNLPGQVLLMETESGVNMQTETGIDMETE